jgi:hypothetical protein
VTSFIRTIAQSESQEYVNQILSRSDHFIPLKFQPRRARPGDFIYLAHRGRIVGRAVIRSIDPTLNDVPIASDQLLYAAEWLVRYRGGWQRSPRRITFRGYQGIR